MNKSEAIKTFLANVTLKEISCLYSKSMECQVNVSQDGGERIDGEFKGRAWHGWTDNIQTWKSFRIPRNANTVPEDNDDLIKFDLAEHAEGIGMTGWDWENKISKWVAFDFDALTGHSAGHNDEIIQQIKEAASNIEWVTIRKSTSGKGLHFYIFLDNVPTSNHSEHSALARSIIGLLSAITGFSFSTKVDVCGGNMWCWHRKMRGTDGLTLLKQGTVLYDVPVNWKDHVKVVTGNRNKTLPQNIESDTESLFEDLTSQRLVVQLDDEHKRLIKFLTESNSVWWWDSDHHMLVTHTIHLKEAHNSLQLKGIFETVATGKDKGHDHNVFMFPNRRGSWVVRRFTPGVQESSTWKQDSSGWTKCFLNKEPDLQTVAESLGGIEHPAGGFEFREAEIASKASLILGADLKLPSWITSRRTRLKPHKDGRLVVEINADPNDIPNDLDGWLSDKGKWKRIFTIRKAPSNDPETTSNCDDVIRHVTTQTGDDYGWVIKAEGRWQSEPLVHIKAALDALGFTQHDSKLAVGNGIFKAWVLVNKPFQPEYPGNREWNRCAAQLKYSLSTSEILSYPNWLKILNHCGAGLDYAIKENPWAKANGIKTGADYLKCWLASMFQEPMEPLPYLFLWGPQNSGKSILHEAISLLLTGGYIRADAALISQSGFNAELRNAVLCIVEETDLRKNIAAYNRIKDWVTARSILIHEKLRTPFLIPNSTHWIQCANSPDACPIFPGDVRIVSACVDELDPTELIPKKELLIKLESEAIDFITALMSLEIPPSNDRLNVPVIATDDKALLEGRNMSALQTFITERCHNSPGHCIKFSEFFDKFVDWLDSTERFEWSKIRVGRELPPQNPKGRVISEAGQFYIGNLSFEPHTEVSGKFVVRSGNLVLLNAND